jgi:hypothetical protein
MAGYGLAWADRPVSVLQNLTPFVNNDGWTEDPDGEVDFVPRAAVRVAGHYQFYVLVGMNVYPEGGCDPAGIIAGPGNQLDNSCRPGSYVRYRTDCAWRCG